MQAPQVDTVLVAVDGSEESREAADYAVAIAGTYVADLVVLHVLPGEDYHALTTGDADPSDHSEKARTFLDPIVSAGHEADVSVRTASAYGFSVHHKLIHPGSVVLDAAEDLEVDFIVLPREPIVEDSRGEGTLAKAAEYTLLYASQPVLAT